MKRIGQGGELRILLFVAGFVSFLGFIVTSGGISILLSGEADGISQSPLETSVCDIGGWNAVVDAVSCAVSNVSYFVNFLFIESQYAALNQLLFLPLSVGIIYIILKIIRGGG